MNEDIQKEIEELKRTVQELSDWKKARENQQISFPVDDISRRVMLEKVPKFITTGAGTTANGTISVDIDGTTYYILKSATP